MMFFYFVGVAWDIPYVILFYVLFVVTHCCCSLLKKDFKLDVVLYVPVDRGSHPGRGPVVET